MAEGTIGRNLTFPILNSDGTPFNDLVLNKASYDSIVMSLGDKITGDVYYRGTGLAVTMSEYIEYNGVKFVLVNPPTILREGMVSDNSELKGMTKYSFVFYHPMYVLGNFPFADVAVTSDQQKYLSQNKSFSWIGNLTDYVVKLNKNLQGTEWVCEIGNSVTSDIYGKLSDVLTFDNQTIADALKTAYDTWKVPYIIDVIARTDARYSQGKRFVVHFGLPSTEILDSNNAPFVFEYGKGVGLKNNSRTPKNNKIITRIAGYGSENNIPYGYPQIVWTGNQDWDFTINNSSSAANSYPIYDGIVNGQRVRLIKHPFTRNHLMPSIYSETVNKKVNPNATGYDPTIEIKDYYDAISSGSYTYPNPINPSAPSYEIHEFEDIKPELGQASLAGVSAYDDKNADAISLSDAIELLKGYYTESTNETEKEQLANIIAALPSATQDGSTATVDTYSYDWLLTSDSYYAYLKYTSSILNFSHTVLRAQQAPTPTWDDTMDDDGNYVQSYFKVTLPQLSFDLYACAAITEEMSVNMRSGACIGCTFPIQVDWDDYKKNFYDADGNFDPVIGEGHPRNGDKYPNSASGQITVIVQKDLDTFGTLMPNRYQTISAGDQFVILGISLPLSYVTSAESRLDAEMVQYMKDNNEFYFEYPLKFDEHFLATHTDILSQIKPNVIVRFKYNGTTIPLYIKQMTVKFGQSPLPQYDITLTDDVQVVLNQIGKAVETFRTMMQNQGVDIGALESYFDGRYDGRYLSKVNDDTAAGFVRLLRGMQVGERFVSGLLGEGGVFRTEADGTTYIEVDKMYVRMRAYFDSVEIRRFLHSGGNRIASLAGIKCSRVEYIDANGDVTEDATEAVKFRCYFRANDNGNTVTNDFVVGDLAFCKETNAYVASGIEQHGYWRAVVGKNSTLTDNGEGWIDLSASDCLSGSDIPIAQDDIVQLGNKTDTTRQGAIIEYVGGADAPSYQIYQNINDYSLNGKNYISMGYSSSTGRAYMNVAGDFRFGSQTDSGGSYIKYNQQTRQMEIKATVQFTSPYTQQETDLDAFAAAVKANEDALQQQIDGEIDTWFYEGTPTLNNAPASDWTTVALKERHLGDLYYDIGTGQTAGFAYRFIKTTSGGVDTYSWQYIDDTAITQALALAALAKDTADNKRRVFLAQPTPPYDEGDLWANATYPSDYTGETDEANHRYKNDLLRCVTPKASSGVFSINDWQLASKYTDDSALTTFINGDYASFVQNIGQQVDGKAETWYQDTDPSNAWTTAELKESHVGDIWYDTSANGGKKTYIWQDFGTSANPRYAWAEAQVPDDVFDKIDGKMAIYTSWEAWIDADNVNQLQVRDLFIPSADTTQGGVAYKANKVYRCTNASTPTFQEVAYTDDTTVNAIIAKYGQILNIQSPTADNVGEALAYLREVLTGSTSIDGGLVLTNAIYMKDRATNPNITAGLTGVYQRTETGTGWKGWGTAAWYGGGVANGIPIDYEATQGHVPNYAKSLFRFDGSGYLAGGNITWDKDGVLTVQGNQVSTATLILNGTTVDLSKFVTTDTAQTITALKTFTVGVVTNKLYLYKPNSDDTNAVYFVKDSTGVKLVGAGFYTDSFVSALGTSSGGGGGGSVSLNEPLSSINSAGLGAPSQSGSAIIWDGSAWKYSRSTTLNVNALSVANNLSAYNVSFGGTLDVAGNITALGGNFVASLGGYKVTGKDNSYVLLAGGSTTKLKTINGNSLFGEGNIDVSGGSGGNYLPLSGGTITGYGADILTINRLSAQYTWIKYLNNGNLIGYLGVDSVGLDLYYQVPSTFGVARVWHSQNDGSGSELDADLLDGQHGTYYAAASSLSNYLPLSGGTMAGNIAMASNSITFNSGSAIYWYDDNAAALYQVLRGNDNGNIILSSNAQSLFIRPNGTNIASGQTIFDIYGGITTGDISCGDISSGKISITYANTTYSDSPISISNSITTTSHFAISSFSSAAASNARVSIIVGKAPSTYNSAGFAYYHVANDSASNYASISLYGASDLLCVLGNGRVGIGTSSPTCNLSVIGTFGTTGNSSVGGILDVYGVTYTRSIINYGSTANAIQTRGLDGSDANGVKENLYINNNHNGNIYMCGGGGNVFIGSSSLNTSTLLYKLNVDGTVYADVFKKHNGTSSQFLKADGSVDSNVYALNSSLGSYLPLSGGTITGPGSDILSINRTSASYVWIHFFIDSSSVGYLGVSDSKELFFQPNSGDLYTVWHSGNDGSGSGLDADLLDGQHATYYATASSLSNYLPLTGGTLTNTLTINKSSHTVYSDSALIVNCNSSTGIWGAVVMNAAMNAGTRTTVGVGLSTTNYNSAYYGFYYAGSGSTSNYATIGLNNAPDLLCVLGNGNVGVGTSTPSYKLSVNGTTYITSTLYTNKIINFGATANAIQTRGLDGSDGSGHAEDLYINHNHSGNVYFCYSGGSVGIGTASISYKLHVGGTFYASGAGSFGSTLSVAGLLTASGGIQIPAGSSIMLGGATISWDATNSCVKVSTGLYSTASISALGTSSGSGSSSTLNEPLASINTASLGAPSSVGQTVVWNGASWQYSNTTQLNAKNLQVSQTCSAYTLSIGSTASVAGSITAEAGSVIVKNGRLLLGYSSGGTSYRFYCKDNGYISGTLTQGSDIRRKNVLGVITTLDVNTVSFAPIFRFTWKDSEDYREYAGTSAQYWRTYLPQTVLPIDNGYLSMDYGATALIATVITARKVVEHERRIADLERENAILKEELRTIKAA